MKHIIRFFFVASLFLLLSCGSGGSGGSSDSDSPSQPGREDGNLSNVGYATFNLTADTFNCDGFIEASQNVPTLHITFLYNTFGNNFACLERLLADNRLASLEVNLINEPGHRNGRLGSYEFLANVGSPQNYDQKLRANDPALQAAFVEYVKPLQAALNNLRSDTALYINPGLESNVSDAAGAVLVSWARTAFPDAKIVWNPLSPSPARRAATSADVIEGHNISPDINAPCIYNMDGTDVSYPNLPAIGETNHEEGQPKNWVQSGAPLNQLIEEFANRCDVAYIWTAESNGINRTGRNFVDPRSRNHFISTELYKQIFADVENLQIQGEVYPTDLTYSSEDDAVVSSCDFVSDAFADVPKGGRLLKQSEFRDRGGVIILPREFSQVRQVTIVKQNSVVDTYRNTGSYKDGRTLFRSDVSPTKYPLKTYLTFQSGSKKICYKIPNPRIRID